MARILVVDDEPSILEMLNSLLKTDGHEVVATLGGVKAKEVLDGDGGAAFDLMITDIRMNPINGMELLRLSRDLHPTMSVIMLTAYGQVETAIEALQLGAFDYIAKPFKIDKLLGTIHRALECRQFMSQGEG
jgi:DNA-binding NtrC family response regulator